MFWFEELGYLMFTYMYTIWLMLEHKNSVTCGKQVIFQKDNLLIYKTKQ